MTYTINGKEYTEFDIKLCCSELMDITIYTVGESKVLYRSSPRQKYDPINDPSDTWPIIEKISNRLLEVVDRYNGCHRDGQYTHWEYIASEHNCTKLIAACICFIEMKEQGQ